MPRKEIIAPPNMRRPNPPFSLGTRFGDLVFVAGQAAHSLETHKVEGGIREQTRLAMERLKMILEAGGASLDDVLNTSCWLADIGEFNAFDEEYARYFPGSKPARTTLQSTLMAENGRVEIAAVASASSSQKRKEVVQPSNHYVPNRPYSHGVKYGDLLFIAGETAFDPSIQGAQGDLRQQIHSTLDRVKLILDTAGSSMDNVLNLTCYLSTNNNFEEFNQEYATYFPSNRPARATLQLVQPARNGLFEVEGVACTSNTRKEVIAPPHIRPPRPPFSLATRVGDLVYVAGQAAVNPDTRRAEGDIREQTRTVIERIKAILEASGTSLENALDARCWIARRSDFAAMNEEYRSYFPDNQPARATVEATLMAPNGLVEIAVVAGVPS